MLRSMTGYGEASADQARFALSVEIRTVNSRFLKISTKIPEEIGYLQPRLEEITRARLQRGSVSLIVRFEPASVADLYEIDTELVRKYLSSLASLSAELGRREELRLDSVLSLPGVVRVDDVLSVGRELVEPAAEQALGGALDAVIAMRTREGTNLHADLSQRASVLEGLLAEVRAGVPAALDDHFRKLDERVRRILGDRKDALSADDILKEAAILAERSDISEELARMASHLEQFQETLALDGGVGRRLEFIVQEMFRESNTMGSKAPGSALNQPIVEIKAEVDRLKEQVANVE